VYREVLWEWNDKIANEHLTSWWAFPPWGTTSYNSQVLPGGNPGFTLNRLKWKIFTYTVCILYVFSIQSFTLARAVCLWYWEKLGIIWFWGGNTSSIPLIMSLCCHIDRFSMGLNPRLLLKKRTPVTSPHNKELIQKFFLQLNSWGVSFKKLTMLWVPYL